MILFITRRSFILNAINPLLTQPISIRHTVSSLHTHGQTPNNTLSRSSPGLPVVATLSREV